MSSKDGTARAAGPDRPAPEDYVAERIKQEREARGWSTVTVADKMAEAGHPLNQSAIWRIESGKPRRRVNLDEALGFCQVFGLTMDELTAPSLEHIDPVIHGYVRSVVDYKHELTRLQRDVRILEGQIDGLEFELARFASDGSEQKAELEELMQREEQAWQRKHA